MGQAAARVGHGAHGFFGDRVFGRAYLVCPGRNIIEAQEELRTSRAAFDLEDFATSKPLRMLDFSQLDLFLVGATPSEYRNSRHGEEEDRQTLSSISIFFFYDRFDMIGYTR